MADVNTTEPGAHPGAGDQNTGGEEKSLFAREVSADGMVRLHPGDSVGINLGMGVADDGREKQPVSLAADTVSETRELFQAPGQEGPNDGGAAQETQQEKEDAVKQAAAKTTKK